VSSARKCVERVHAGGTGAFFYDDYYPAPSAHLEPESLSEDKSEIANDLVELARAIAARRIRRKVAVELSAERNGRSVTTSQMINGRHVQVQRRAAVRHPHRVTIIFSSRHEGGNG
jgi:hypothetical protein